MDIPEADRHRAAIYRIYKIGGHPQEEYIGQASDVTRRWGVHRSDLNSPTRKHHAAYLQNAWNKYGPRAFGWEVIQFVDNLDDLDSLEQWYITTRQPKYNTCYWVKQGMRGIKARPETRQKMSEAQKRRPDIAYWRGKKHRPEHIAKRIETILSKYQENGTSEKHTKAMKRVWEEMDPAYREEFIRRRQNTFSQIILKRKEVQHQHVLEVMRQIGWGSIIPLTLRQARLALIEPTGYKAHTVDRVLKELEAEGKIQLIVTSYRKLKFPNRKRSHA